MLADLAVKQILFFFGARILHSVYESDEQLVRCLETERKTHTAMQRVTN